MLKNKAFYCWLVVYLFVVGCVVWPDGGSSMRTAYGESTNPAIATSRISTAEMPYRGVAIQIQRMDWMDRYKQCIDEIAGLGADTVSLVIDTRMENGTSSRIWLDMRMAPTPDQLGDLIDHAKGKGLRVMLMPIVLLDNPEHNEWRGTIEPKSWSNWFESYRGMMNHFSWIAQAHNVDILVVGSELVSTESKLDEWTRTIKEIREVFKGKLTYSSNWDHYVGIGFWNQLDLIGMNSYWKLGDNSSATVVQIKQKWQDIQSDLLKFRKKIGKPLLFTEVGWCSLDNAAHEPWDYTKVSESINLDIQKKLYEGFFQSWYGNPELGGFMIWEWPPEQGGPSHKGYIPKGKPAEQVLRQWLAKPKWQVQ